MAATLFRCLALIIFVAAPGYAEVRLLPSLSSANQSAETYDGRTIEASVTVLKEKSWSGSLGIQHLERTYQPATKISDTGYEVGATKTLLDGYYIQSQIFHAPDAEIVPLWRFAIEPRRAIGAVDFGLGLEYRKYQNVNTGSLHPNALFDVNDFVSLFVGAFAARSDATLFASHGYVALKPSSNHVIKLGGAVGETLEDAGISAQFKSATISYDIRFEPLTFGIEATRYSSDLRHEDSFRFRLGFW